jgi:hypothetical protein
MHHVNALLHQLHVSLSTDHFRRKLALYFEHSICHRAVVLMKEMDRLRRTRVPHPAYSPDLAICAFYLFGDLKAHLDGSHPSTREGQGIQRLDRVIRASRRTAL